MDEDHNEEILSRFLDECCTVGGRDRTPTKALWAAWRKWAKASDLVPGRQHDLTNRLAARGMATVLEDDELFVAGLVLRPGAIRVCRYCHRLIVSETCDCRLDARLEGWEGPGEAPEERGGSLPPNKYAAPAAQWRKTAPAGAGLRGGGEVGASRQVDRFAKMDNFSLDGNEVYRHGGAGRTQRAPGGAPAAKTGMLRAWRDRFSQVPIPKQSVRLRNGALSTPINVGVTLEELEPEPEGVFVLDETTLEALLKSCSGQTPDAYRDTTFLRVLYDTRATVTELAAAWLQDVDLGAGVLTIKGSTARRALLSNATLEALHRYLPMRSTKLRHAITGEPDCLWVARDGSRLTGTAIDAMFRKRCLRAGFGAVHIEEICHELREATETEASDQHFGTFQRIDRGEQKRFERGNDWVDPVSLGPKWYLHPEYLRIHDPEYLRLHPEYLRAENTTRFDSEYSDDEKDDGDDDGPFEYFAGPSEEEEEAATEQAYGLPAGTLAAERALETEAEKAARLAAEADEIFQV